MFTSFSERPNHEGALDAAIGNTDTVGLQTQQKQTESGAHGRTLIRQLGLDGAGEPAIHEITPTGEVNWQMTAESATGGTPV